jgi:hypothetical protein
MVRFQGCWRWLRLRFAYGSRDSTSEGVMGLQAIKYGLSPLWIAQGV